MVKEDKTLGILTHVLGIFTGFIGALIIYLVAEDKKLRNMQEMPLIGS